MLLAFADGFLRIEELRPVDPYSRSWRMRLDLRLSAYEAKRHREYQIAWNSHCGSAAAVLAPEGAQRAWELANESMKVIRKLFLPWQKDDDIASASSTKALQQKWESNFGSMDDPAVRAAINNTARALIESARRSRQGLLNKDI